MVDGTDKVEYFYNTATRMVEKGRQSSWDHLLGPYETFEEAARAVEIAKARSEDWDESDAAWREGSRESQCAARAMPQSRLDVKSWPAALGH